MIWETINGKLFTNSTTAPPFTAKSTGSSKKQAPSQAIFKSDQPYSRLHEKYGSLLDSITFMPVIETDYGGNLQQITDYQEHLRPYAIELVFSQDSISLIQNPALLKKQGGRIWVNALWPDLCGGHNDDLAVLEGKPEKAWGWLIAQSVDIIQTDRPRELIAYLRKRKLHK